MRRTKNYLASNLQTLTASIISRLHNSFHSPSPDPLNSPHIVFLAFAQSIPQHVGPAITRAGAAQILAPTVSCRFPALKYQIWIPESSLAIDIPIVLSSVLYFSDQTRIGWTVLVIPCSPARSFFSNGLCSRSRTICENRAGARTRTREPR